MAYFSFFSCKKLPWAFRTSYGMLDQAGINSCISYKFSYSNEAMQHRQVLRQLSYALFEPHFLVRLVKPTLSKNLRACILFMLNTEVPAQEERTNS